MPVDAVQPNDPREQLQQAQEELRRRQHAGQPCRAEPLFALYPRLAREVHLALELIGEEVRLRRHTQDAADAAELMARFPQWQDWLAILDLGGSEVPATPLSATDRWTKAEKSELPSLPSENEGDRLGRRVGRYQVKGVLGRGGFGTVYLGFDEDLDREVAIKVPHRQRLRGPEDIQLYLQEARMVASLDHPHIVPVHDYGTQGGLPFVVSKFIPGSNLAARMSQARLAPNEVVSLVATIAEALHYAHGRGLFHRDVKPGNILLDTAGKPYLTDFGLALREEDFGKGATFAGTPPYMSPEQARGEGHRVDGRSDVFSLGVVFYELLTGRRPFRGADQDELLEQIANADARPPRQVDDTIPRELERICLKALSKPATQRYTTAKDMAEDLRCFLAPATAVAPAVAAVTEAVHALPGPAPASSKSDVQVVPKGLRSFDDRDTYFFLELLPGPRDREGLPESLRFWKDRIEQTDADHTFAVGLLCGPSGCGKSSLVKAGLLPRLANHVHTVYVEATGAGTGTRLLKGLRKRCAELPANKDLAASLAALRRATGLEAGQKVLLVLDQFEQWLHGCHGRERTELVQALRQCDGGRVQCLILVRDDFWMATSRFLQEVEVPLREGDNAATVDLFDGRHAKKVLTLFGRALGALPGRDAGLTSDQDRFLDQAVEGLSQDGKVIPVRLALFADMIKGREWTPATLKAVGGMEGVGVTFLEEAFSAATAPPSHRHHQAAARAVLKALLPEQGTHIRGTMRARDELLEASGYGGSPREFDELMGILDRELRLVSPSDPEGTDSVSGRERAATQGQFYQLTHDYLVPALRDWLTRKQKETLRGRAQLRLGELAALWKDKPEKRHLPSALEYIRIRLLTRRRDWTAAEQKMMRASRRHYELRALLLAAGVAAMGLGVWEYRGRLKAQALVENLLRPGMAGVSPILDELARNRRWAEPLVQEASAEPDTAKDPERLLKLRLALLRWDHRQVSEVRDRLLEAGPQDFTIIRRELAPPSEELTEWLWSTVRDRSGDPARRFRAACALAEYTPEDARWQGQGKFVVGRLMAENILVLGFWKDSLQRVGRHLLPALAASVEDGNWGTDQRLRLLELYRAFSVGQKYAIDPLKERLAQAERGKCRRESSAASAKRQANIAAALIALGHGDAVWRLLVHSEDPSPRSYLIERLGSMGVDPRVLERRLDEESDPSARYALLLSLGNFPSESLGSLEPSLRQWYEKEPDGGIHAAAGWLLRRLDRRKQVAEIDAKLQTGRVEGGRRWYVSNGGQTFVVVPRQPRMDHDFAIAATEVSVAQFWAFRKDHRIEAKELPSPDCPINRIRWYEAAEYCNWLTEQDHLGADQQCYAPGKGGKLEMVSDYPRRRGYRLPTAAEWKHACRAGARTRWAFGEGDEELVNQYEWWHGNSTIRGNQGPSPVASLKPNDWGLFDMHGNLSEWGHEVFVRPKGELPIFGDDIECQVLGGTFMASIGSVSSESLIPFGRNIPNPGIGFRPVRTFP